MESGSVLCDYEGRRRVVTWTIGEDATQRNESLLLSAKRVFSDLIRDSDKGSYFVQVEDKKHGLIDLVDDVQLSEKDTVYLKLWKRTEDEVDKPTDKVKQLCKKLGKPSEANAAVLATLFPACGSKSNTRKRSFNFDPSDECVAANAHRRKKAVGKGRPKQLKVVLLEEIPPSIPKGSVRDRLRKAGRIKDVAVLRSTSPDEVKEDIADAFEELGHMKSLQYLQAHKDNTLHVALEQELDGVGVIKLAGSGSLYVKQNRKKSVIAATAVSETPRQLHSDSYERSGEVLASLKAPVPLSPLTPIYVSSESEDSDTQAEKERELVEFRMIREQQDREYEESLIIDQEKAAQKARDAERKAQESERVMTRTSSLQKIRCALGPKYSSSAEGAKVSFRLLDGSKVEHSFCLTSCTQDLYEFVVVSGQDSPFTLLQAFPQQVIPVSCTTTIADLQLGLACVLTVAEREDSFDPLLLLESESAPVSSQLVDDSIAGSNLETFAANNLLLLLKGAEDERNEFSMQFLNACSPLEGHIVRRSHLYEDVATLYGSVEVACEYPFEVKFEGEQAVDCGGVSRDMLSGFWDEAYRKLFDGCALLTPVIHPQVDMALFPVIGRIISHGYLTCSFLPVRVAFPTLACMLLGPNTVIPEDILVSSFPDCLSEYEANVVRQALTCNTPHSFTTQLKSKLVGVLSRFGCREVPTYQKVREVMINVARYEFTVKPLVAVSQIHGGIPAAHSPFWNKKSVLDLNSLYLALTATPAKVVEIMESDASNEAEDRIMGYVEQFVGNLTQDALRKFLRFTTGSSVCLAQKITVTFNNVDGLARRPISHTCNCVLELSTSYVTYPEFVLEFEMILAQPEVSWSMDSI